MVKYRGGISMKTKLISCLVLTLFTLQAKAIIGGGNPLGGVAPDMGRTAQTLNQMDQSQDGKLHRNQGHESEVDKPSLSSSYNDQAHRDYVRRRKSMKKKTEKEF